MVKIKRDKVKLPSNFKRGIDNFLLMGTTIDFEAINKDDMKLFFGMLSNKYTTYKLFQTHQKIHEVDTTQCNHVALRRKNNIC